MDVIDDIHNWKGKRLFGDCYNLLMEAVMCWERGEIDKAEQLTRKFLKRKHELEEALQNEKGREENGSCSRTFI